MKTVTSQHEKILLYHLFLSYISNDLLILMTGIMIMYFLLFYMYYYVLIYFFYVFFYFVYLFFLHLYIEWRVMSSCSMQVWPRFSSRVSHNNPHQLGHSRPGLYHYLFLFIFLGKKISFQTSILLLLH